MEDIIDDILDSEDGFAQTVAKLAVGCRKAEFVESPFRGDDRQLIRDEDGEINFDDTLVPPRNYESATIHGFAQTVNDLSPMPDIGEVRIFVGANGATALLDERGERCDRVRMPLSILPSFARFESDFQIDQPDLIWLLRSEYADRFAPETFLPAIKKVRFRDGQSGVSEVQHGRETIDLSVEAELTGVDESLAEELVFQTSVFDVLAAEATPPLFPVRCAVRILPKSRAFVISPIEGQYVSALAAATRTIVSEMTSKLDRLANDENLPSNVKIFQDSTIR